MAFTHARSFSRRNDNVYRLLRRRAGSTHRAQHFLCHGELAERLTKNPGAVSQVYLSGTSAAGGGLPIKVGNEVIDAVGVSGSAGVPGSNVPGGTRDEACSQAGIDKVADQLK